MTRKGQALRFSLRAHREASTRAGRKYARLAEGDEVIYVEVAMPRDLVAAAASDGHALICKADEIAILGSAGKGVSLMKLEEGQELVAARVLRSKTAELVVENEKGTTFAISASRQSAAARGGKGSQLFKRGKLTGRVHEDPDVPQLAEPTKTFPRPPKSE